VSFPVIAKTVECSIPAASTNLEIKSPLVSGLFVFCRIENTLSKYYPRRSSYHEKLTSKLYKKYVRHPHFFFLKFTTGHVREACLI
jgi:hypothetical protein